MAPRRDLIYLTGGVRERDWPRFVRAGFGLMLTPAAGARVAAAARVPVIACDNGCYTQGDRFRLDRYLAWLDAMTPAQGACLFATAPDVLGDHAATWRRSAPVLPELRQRGYRAALVAQDGLTPAHTPWDDFDCLFIGGTTEFKLGAVTTALAHEAKARGKWLHIGRVNSGIRLAYARRLHADSCDGSYAAFNPTEALSRMGRWLARANAPQLPLPLVAAALSEGEGT